MSKDFHQFVEYTFGFIIIILTILSVITLTRMYTLWKLEKYSLKKCLVIIAVVAGFVWVVYPAIVGLAFLTFGEFQNTKQALAEFYFGLVWGAGAIISMFVALFYINKSYKKLH